MSLAQAEKVLSQGTHQTGLSNLIPARKSKEIVKSQNSLSQRQSDVHLTIHISLGDDIVKT